jgi:hypothetical protein
MQRQGTLAEVVFPDKVVSSFARCADGECRVPCDVRPTDFDLPGLGEGFTERDTEQDHQNRAAGPLGRPSIKQIGQPQGGTPI